MEEVLGIKGDGGPGHRDVLVQSAAVADVGPHSEGHSFSLQDEELESSDGISNMLVLHYLWSNSSSESDLGPLQLNRGLLLPLLTAALLLLLQGHIRVGRSACVGIS